MAQHVAGAGCWKVETISLVLVQGQCCRVRGLTAFVYPSTLGLKVVKKKKKKVRGLLNVRVLGTEMVDVRLTETKSLFLLGRTAGRTA